MWTFFPTPGLGQRQAVGNADRFGYARRMSETPPAPPLPDSAATPEQAPTAAPPGPPAKWVVPPNPGEVIISEMTRNSYTMGQEIGEGHFGRVFGCVDIWGNKLAAKVMKPIGSYEKVKA